MDNELKQKLETIISPRLLLENLPTSSYGVAFVAWGVYNKIGQDVFEDVIRTTAEEFVKAHRFCIKIVDPLILAAQIRDEQSFIILSKELIQHPECFKIFNQMFPKEEL